MGWAFVTQPQRPVFPFRPPSWFLSRAFARAVRFAPRSPAFSPAPRLGRFLPRRCPNAPWGRRGGGNQRAPEALAAAESLGRRRPPRACEWRARRWALARKEPRWAALVPGLGRAQPRGFLTAWKGSPGLWVAPEGGGETSPRRGPLPGRGKRPGRLRGAPQAVWWTPPRDGPNPFVIFSSPP